MKTKMLLATLALVISPGVSLAQGCDSGHTKEQVVMSCAEGSVFDAETQNCVPQTTS